MFQDTVVTNFTARLVLSADKNAAKSDGGKVIEFHGPADITQESTAAIVNAANSSLLGGGGVDGAIHRAGGPAVLDECKRIVREIGHLPAGRAVVTNAGNLAAKFVIHTVGPIYRGGEHGEAEILASCYRECIRLADEHEAIPSLSFPSISTGAYGYPVPAAANIAVTTVFDSLSAAKRVHTVRFVLFDARTLKAYVRAAEQFHHATPASAYKLEKGFL
jgi:O-acetyl-ADP-ribose deacetylase (regulator of RNase III)